MHRREGLGLVSQYLTEIHMLAKTCEILSSICLSSGCNEIKRNPNFTACHDSVNPDPYLAACKHEACLCNKGGDCACFCSAIASYVRACNQHGISITWRREGFCGKHYKKTKGP